MQRNVNYINLNKYRTNSEGRGSGLKARRVLDLEGIVVIVVCVGVNGGEIDAGETFERGKEGGGHGGADPAGDLVQLLARYDAGTVAALHCFEIFDSVIGNVIMEMLFLFAMMLGLLFRPTLGLLIYTDYGTKELN
ncbi:hypothetical protein SLA2020_101440 [Shorea laevis]